MLRSLPPRVRHLLAQRRFVVAALVVLWAAELFVVQEVTLVERHYYAAYQPLLHRLVRGSLDLLACAALVLLLPRAVLALFFAAGVVLAGVLLSFERYTGDALSATMIVATAGEGTAVADAGLAMVPPAAALLLVGLAAKLFLLHRLGRLGRPPLAARWPLAAKLVAAYLAVVALTSFYKPFRLLLGWESVGGIGSVYGYAPTWAAELVLLDRDEILERARRRAAIRSDALHGIEAPFPVGDRLVFLQVESLDYAATLFEVDGRPVTPVLRDLATRSMSYAIESRKKTGSCDADFTALMGGLPSEDMPNYKIVGFPFEDSFVRELDDAGFHTVALHNVGGAFFNRRAAFAEMGFDELVFKEEMVEEEGLEDDGWATPDHVMLRFAAERIAAANRPSFFMVITATSHIPFDYTPVDRRELFPGADDLTRSYLDSMRYVDAAIGDFVQRLPDGTIVVLYGDHTAGVSDPELGYGSEEGEGGGLVPLLIHRVGDDLSPLQRTRASGLATSGRLSLLDLARYVHETVRASVAAR